MQTSRIHWSFFDFTFGGQREKKGCFNNYVGLGLKLGSFCTNNYIKSLAYLGISIGY